MPAPLDRSPLLGESYELGEDFRVRLRMARSSDLLPIRALLASKHREPEAEVTALVQFDPRRRCVICATASAQLESFNPATGELVGTVAVTAPEDVPAVVDSIAEVQPFWAQLTLEDRARYLERTAQVLIDEGDDIRELIVREQGKPRTEA